MEKSKELVKYSNDLNKLNMSSLKEKELELFYAICVELKEHGNAHISININEFKKDFNISSKIDKKRFGDYIEAVHNKFLEIKATKRTNRIIESVNFFKKFRTDLDTGIMEIQVNEDFAYYLNNLAELYTRFSFLEFQSLNGKYSKLLMPHLIQWDSVKRKFFPREEFFEILGVNDNYKKDLSNFNRKILNPTIKELKRVFKKLKCEKRKEGKEITGYAFKWENSNPLSDLGESFEEFWKYNFKNIKFTTELKKIIQKHSENLDNEIIKKYLLEQWEMIQKNEDIENKEGYFYSIIISKQDFLSEYATDCEELTEENSIQLPFNFTPNIKTVDSKGSIKNTIEEKERLTLTEVEKKYKRFLEENNLTFSKMGRKKFFEKFEIIEEKKEYTIEDIPKEKLLSKSGKKLVGSALKMRIEKILKEMKINR